MKKQQQPRKRTLDQQLLIDCHNAIKDAMEEWDTPDSPEGFAFAMKGLLVLQERIAARFDLPTTTKQ